MRSLGTTELIVQFELVRDSSAVRLRGKRFTVHCIYWNRDYFGDGSVHNTWRPLMIQTIWCSFYLVITILNMDIYKSNLIEIRILKKFSVCIFILISFQGLSKVVWIFKIWPPVHLHIHVYNKYLTSAFNLETDCNKICDVFDHVV
jgi:hypothetical protein